MDPDANLEELLRLAGDIVADADESDTDEWSPESDDARLRRVDFAATRMAELAIALDAWIRGGGFAPTAWTTPPPLPKLG